MPKFFIILFIALIPTLYTQAQNADSSLADSARKENKLFKGMVNALSRDTSGKAERDEALRRLDDKYLPYNRMIIRRINIVRVPFGTSFRDTTVHFGGRLTRMANTLHHLTKEKIVRNNLFFRENNLIHPFLMADNERFLRGLPYIRDADFIITPVGNSDTADVTVLIKDLFNLGGDISALTTSRAAGQIVNDNLAGTGNAAMLYASYDMNRKKKFSLGGEFIRRNIGGSFINQRLGIQTYYRSIRKVPRQENYLYYRLDKQLLHRYDKLTYELDASYHTTKNRFDSDSLYNADFKYRYFQFEGWLGYNIIGKKISETDESKRLRLLTSLRVINQKFIKKPSIYDHNYSWQFADLTGILASFTLYRQNFFKTQYMYGFGINEDIPQGLNFTATTGYTIKQEQTRPFIGIDLHRYGFTIGENYVDLTFRAEGYLGDNHEEDVTLLASMNYITKLRHLNPRWRQRFFFTLSASRQLNTTLNEPLFIKSKFAMPEFGEDLIGGDARITAMAESVFFSPWSWAGFRVAPVVSYNITAFSPKGENLNIYSSVGAGFRVRNESLVFETIEFKAYLFPQGNAHGDKFSLDLSTSFSLTKGDQFIQKPDFISAN